jgi:ATP-dependent DNA ligase
VVFDILENDGKSLVDFPLIERKAILKESVKEGSHVIINDYVEEKGEQFYKAVLQQDLIYQVLTRDCKLMMPRLHALRFDKNASECTLDQIEGKGKCFKQRIGNT